MRRTDRTLVEALLGEVALPSQRHDGGTGHRIVRAEQEALDLGLELACGGVELAELFGGVESHEHVALLDSITRCHQDLRDQPSCAGGDRRAAVEPDERGARRVLVQAPEHEEQERHCHRGAQQAKAPARRRGVDGEQLGTQPLCALMVDGFAPKERDWLGAHRTSAAGTRLTSTEAPGIHRDASGKSAGSAAVPKTSAAEGSSSGRTNETRATVEALESVSLMCTDG